MFHQGIPYWPRKRSLQVLFVALGAAGVYALIAHWAHAAPYLPWLIVLACPLPHVFMHGGHGSHSNHGRGNAPKADK